MTFSLTTAPVDMEIDARSGVIIWRPTSSELGDYAVVVRAADERGLLTDQPYTLTVSMGAGIVFPASPPCVTPVNCEMIAARY